MNNLQKRILIVGYYGSYNTGDEAILQSLLDLFRASSKDLVFTVISGDPSHTSSVYKVDSVHWQDIPAISNAVKTCDLILIGGGGLFQDYWGYEREQILTPQHHSLSFYGGIPILAKIYEKPYVLYSLGVGPLSSEEAKRLTRVVVEHASLVSVREMGSKKLLESLGLDGGSIHVIPDPAFGLELSGKNSESLLDQENEKDVHGPVVGVCLRNWNIGVSSNKWQQEIAQSLDIFITSTQAQIIFIPFQSVPGDGLQDDVALAENVIKKMKLRDNVRIISDLYPADMTLGLISRCDLVLGMRLHSLIFAIQSGIPAVGLSYDIKIERLMIESGLQDFVLPLGNFSKQELITALQRAYQERSQIREKLIARSKTNLKILTDFSKTVLDLLDSQVSTTDNAEFKNFMRDFNLDKIRQIAMLEDQNQAKTLEEIRSSYAWKGVKLYWSIRQHLIPKGSPLEKPLLFIKKIFRIWDELGPRVFFQTIWQRILEPFMEIVEKILPNSNTWEKDINSILKKHAQAKGVVVILPSIKWSASLFQRPQQMALTFARLGYLVFYLELARPHQNKGYLEIHERIYRSPIPAQTVEHKYAVPLPNNAFMNIEKPITIAYTYNRQFLSILNNHRVVYEYIDELDVFPYEKNFIINNHREFLESADSIVATAKRLHEEVLAVRSDAILCPNGVDYDHFLSARIEHTSHPHLPSDLKKVIKPGQPVIGYYGALARWFDYDLLKQAARLRPDWNFILIGTDYDNTLHPSRILKMPNVHWLGPRPYTELPRYLRFFDVATIPFKVNDITHSTSPLKMFEYFAGHKPVVTTAMHEVQRYADVLIAHNAESFIEQAEKALILKNDPEFIAKLDKIARDNTWDVRVKQLLSSVTE